MMAYQNAFSLPPSSVLLLLHRSRYCYSRASPKHESLYRVKEQRTTNTLIQKVEFDRANVGTSYSELEAKLSGRWLPVTAATLSTATMSNDMGKKESGQRN
jgi:hypothetical protein